MKKKYHIYAIGNAVIDIVTKVNDEALKSQDISKGQMTPIDLSTYHKLVKEFNINEDGLIGGGSIANSINLASQLGAKCFFSGQVANDKLGHFFIDDLAKYSIDSVLNKNNIPDGNSARCLVFITPDAERTMCAYFGDNHEFTTKQLDELAILSSHYLYIEGYLVTSTLGMVVIQKAIEIAKLNFTKIALTFSDPSMVIHFKPQLEKIFNQGVDLLFCNEEEAMKFTGHKDIDKSISALQQSASHVVVTQGAKGVKIKSNEKSAFIEAIPTQCIDTTGAGDAFAGAYLYAISHHKSIEEAAQKANLYAAKVVQQWGARLDLTKD